MKQKLLFALFIALFSITMHADPPTATMAMNQTICPGNSATITLTGTPNCVATITTTPAGIPSTFSLVIGPTGTGIFSTPILQQTTTYNLVELRNFQTQETATFTNLSVTISVVPNGCTRIITDGNSDINSQTVCTPGECRTLVANPTNVPSTSSYEISSIPYCPQGDFNSLTANQINISGSDDIWSAPVTLPFNFSFFNQNYTSCQVGTNGVITFNPQVFPGFCGWDMADLTIPNPAFVHKNSIFGVFQDTDTRSSASPVDASVNWQLTGTYPCRKLVVNFYHLGQYNCGQAQGLQTYQIVLYEISNIIEVYIQSRTACPNWQEGDGVVGIINATGTSAYTPPVRNVNDLWNTTNEAWRFTPSGPNVPVSVRWIQGGNTIATGNTVVVCPIETTSYTAEATYQINGVPFVVNSQQNIINVSLDETQAPNDLSVCFQDSGLYTTDLTVNNAVMLGALNPVDYEIYYYTNLEDAQNDANPLAAPQAFAFSGNQTIYASIWKSAYNCHYVKPFQLIINNPVAAPTGVSPQTLYPGQTLGDLAVNGQNVQWYDAPEGGNLLPNSTVPQNGVTYYATQTVNSCESKTTLTSARLAVQVQVSLGVDEFDRNAFNIYPNPTSNILTLTSTLSDVKLEVFNILSQKITEKALESGSNIIDLSNFASGVYLFQLSLDGKNRTYKIVKN